MTNRFENKSRIFNISEKLYRLFSVLIFAAILVLFYFAVDASGKNTIAKQQESLESALARDIVQCYAIEGMYPPDLAYLENHYGLVYDKKTFFVDYQPIASNLYPDVTVIKINQ
jgi:hypothetical protein